MTAPKITISLPIHVELARQVYKAMKLAFKVRRDNLETNDKPYALAHKMAGELAHAMFGLNNWNPEDADLCNKVHDFAMELISADIRAIRNGKRDNDVETYIKATRETA